MISPKFLVSQLREYNIRTYTGVPCSLHSSLINYLNYEDNFSCLPLNNEGEALAFSCGAYLAATKVAVFTQNSGLGNMINPLTSLSHCYRIPTLLITTWRGHPSLVDEPQHDLMGKITSQILDLASVKNLSLSKSEPDALKDINLALSHMNQENTPFSLLVSPNTIDNFDLPSLENEDKSKYFNSKLGIVDSDRELGRPCLKREEAIQEIVTILGTDYPYITTTGKSSRELYQYADAANIFYLFGAMGCASSLALGLAMFYPQKKIVVLDGDGAALMRLEALVSIGHYKPKNFIHILLDNESYESTGGQLTLSPSVPFEEMAVSCGYNYGTNIISRSKLKEELKKSITHDGPLFLRVRVKPGSSPSLPRPTIKPHEVKDRFMKYLGTA